MIPLLTLLVALLPALLLAPACTGGSGADSAAVDPCLVDPPTAEVGTGDSSFVPLQDGDSVVIVNGPQGGQHILGSLRTRHTTDVVAVHYTITLQSDGTSLSDVTYRLQMLPDGDCGWVYPWLYGYLGFVVGTPDTPGIEDQPVIMRMDIEDQDGRQASDQVIVTAVLQGSSG